MNNSFPGCRVLVIEDEVMVSWILEDMLAELGCVVVGPAVRVDQAVAMVESEAFEFAVLDVNLNGEKSYSVAEALIARDVPFVFSTGYSKDNMPSRYKPFPVLQKPYERERLIAHLAHRSTPKDWLLRLEQ